MLKVIICSFIELIGMRKMECIVCWIGLFGMIFMVEIGLGYLLMMDGVFDGGGCNLVLCLMEVVLVGIGGCIVYDVVVILCKSG